jgi:AcrR family transcriptional regulator
MTETGKINESREKIIDTALELAAEMDWDKVTLSMIARRAGMEIAEVYEEFEDKAALLATFEKRINRRVLQKHKFEGSSESPRDRLFDIMMERFELLNENRQAVISVLHSFCFDPKQVIIGAPHVAASMNWMMELSGIDTSGLRGAAKVMALTGIYVKVLRDWAKDDSPDLSATMAALDRSLGHAEKAADTLKI